MLKIVPLFLIAFSIFISFPIDRIKFIVPPEWESLNQKNSDSSFLTLYHINTENINSNSHFSNAIIRCSSVDSSTNINSSDDIVVQHSGGAQYILSAQDGESWKTYLLLSNDKGEQYILLYRIGIYNNICFEFMMAFPNKREKLEETENHKILTLESQYVVDKEMSGIYCNEEYVKKYSDMFNFVCNSMEIDGHKLFQAKVLLLDTPNDAKFFRDKTLDKL